jgi:hypothetical protein
MEIATGIGGTWGIRQSTLYPAAPDDSENLIPQKTVPIPGAERSVNVSAELSPELIDMLGLWFSKHAGVGNIRLLTTIQSAMSLYPWFVTKDMKRMRDSSIRMARTKSPGQRFSAALLPSATAKSVSPGVFGVSATRSGQSSRGVSPALTEHRASKADASSTAAATTPPPAVRGPSSEELSTRVPSTQERAKVNPSEVKMPEYPAIQPGLKRPFPSDDSVHVRTRTDQEPERKRPRRNNIIQHPLPQKGTVCTRSQTGEERELKQLWIERWKEGVDGRQLKFKGRGRKLVGLLEKSKQRNKSELTSEEIQRRRRGMSHKVELDSVDEEL